jgi:hypothetical protein
VVLQVVGEQFDIDAELFGVADEVARNSGSSSGPVTFTASRTSRFGTSPRWKFLSGRLAC